MRLNRPLWLDEYLRPSLAPWIFETFKIEAASFARLGLSSTPDTDVFARARSANAIVVTKDADFMRLLEAHGPPPAVLWLTFGNTSAAHLKIIFASKLPAALQLLCDGEALVEITER